MDGADGGRIGGAAPVTRMQQIARAVLGLALCLLGLWTLQNFVPALVWASILAIALWPLRQRAARRWSGRHESAIAGVLTFVVALLFIVPMALVVVRVSRDAHGFFEWVAAAQKTGVQPPAFLAGVPIVGQEATIWWRDHLGNPSSSSEWLHRVPRGSLMEYGRNIGSQLAHRLVLFGFTLLTLFFLFRDGERLAQQILKACGRAFGARGPRVAQQMVASVHGTVDGLVLVGIGEGVVLGIVYALAGVPHPTLLGALTAVAAMIPFGAPLIFSIASALLLAQGAMAAALVVFGAGMVVLFVADHVIRPMLIGGATRLPFLWVLLGILGGVETWGLIGLFLGPAIMAALILLWREWTEEPA